MVMRSPICSVLGHVDHGKSSLLDAIRGSAIVESEAGAITQAIGASLIPLATILDVASELLGGIAGKIKLPGLLFIDTPGHAAFTSLRKRGGALADLAILVVDVNEGFKPQTTEALEILKQSKTPFIVAANKIDLIPGWKPSGKRSTLVDLKTQSSDVQYRLDERLYTLVGTLAEHGIQSERFDRLEDYTKQVAIVPVSAKQRIGLPELLATLIGLAQRFLTEQLELHEDEPARGIILEVKEEKGLGTTLDVIIHDGILHTGDTLLFPSLDGVHETKVRALLQPAPLSEMRDAKAHFVKTTTVSAAIGVKILAPDLDDAIAGMPIMAAGDDPDAVREELETHVAQFVFETEQDGLIIRADTLGSLEALSKLLSEAGVPVRRASIGPISRKDLIEAKSLKAHDPAFGMVLGFNVPLNRDVEAEAKTMGIAISVQDVIYRLIEDYERHAASMNAEENRKALEHLPKPVRIRILPGFVFRQSNPAIVGCIVERGELVSGIALLSGTKRVGTVKAIQQDKERVPRAGEGTRVAVSIEGAVVGRSIEENDALTTDISEDQYRIYKEHKDVLTTAEKEVLGEIAAAQRTVNNLWGV
jgi:translation initiation factor 5B